MQKAIDEDGVPASVQFPLKWDAMRQLARENGHSSKAEAINWFLQNQTDKTMSARSVIAYLDKTMKGVANNATSQKALLRGMIAVASFRGSIADFAITTYDEWLQRLPADIQRSATTHRPIWSAPKVRFCESDVAGSELREWETNGVVDQRHMYETREAASYWRTTRTFKAQSTRHQYSYCKDNLSATMARIHEKMREVNQVVMLGAGSPDKDFEVVRYFVQQQATNLKATIVDSSFNMLVETHAELVACCANEGINDRVTIDLCCIDFVKTSSWECCELEPGVNRVIFLLGGTIGNLREREFFDALQYLRAEHPAAIIVIGGQFFDTKSDLLMAENEILASYSSPASEELALSSVIDPLRKYFKDFSYSDLLKAVGKTFVSAGSAGELKSMMSSDVPETMAVRFRLAFDPPQQIRLTAEYNYGAQKALDLVVSRRYVRSSFQLHVNHRLKAESEFIDHPSGKFSHFIVWPTLGLSTD